MAQKKKLQGFTLVEVIVVLVILAILAALLVPRLTGYVDRGRDQELIQQCNSCVKAAQAAYSQAYADNIPVENISIPDIEKLAEVDSDGTVSNITDESYGITHLTYTRDGRSVTYCRNYKTCDSHPELYNFTDGSNQKPENAVDYFYISGIDGDYIKVKTLGDLSAIGGGFSVQRGEVYYLDGKYYCTLTQNWVSSGSEKAFLTNEKNAFEIDPNKEVIDKGNANMSQAVNYKGLSHGDIIYNNGQYKAYLGVDPSNDVGDYYWRTLPTE